MPPILAGIVANPASGRDIRRLTAKASVFPTAEKAQMVQRLLGAFGRFGIDEVLMMPDVTGISALVAREVERRRNERDGVWPALRFAAIAPAESVADTHAAVDAMCAAGARLIAVLGGDGTHRAVAKRCGETPLLTLSTGTNNVFPDLREATVAGIAGALVATGAVPRAAALRRNKVLRVHVDGPRGAREELALVDVCVSRATHVGSRAIWRSADLRELYVTFAEEDAIGLSALAAAWSPVGRDEPRGVWMRFAGDDGTSAGSPTLAAPIAPGLIADVAIGASGDLIPGQAHEVRGGGTLALDGEREIECRLDESYRIELDLDGPLTVDVVRALRYSARHRLTAAMTPALAGIANGRI